LIDLGQALGIFDPLRHLLPTPRTSFMLLFAQGQGFGSRSRAFGDGALMIEVSGSQLAISRR
jgi:hypothetical protein